ncbi:hypothetical protein IVA77_07830 [Bradyrhizobium sp. 136]|nr:hypothetical protein [Bradyrhizobium sp. 45]MCK1436709.1 hypothetical protein [Bradyrhizobium sp. 15]MCK1603976.1 hypothetical protein [Bradyrhizobium sp. 166]MCK1611395.1 hypothetical protein [Bradyrhizobium sp. 163]MCK1761510.1 hypothetical protein [Bradyrhizobium sp. 136]
MATVTWDVAAAVITTAGAGAVIAVGASRTNATSGAAFDRRLRKGRIDHLLDYAKGFGHTDIVVC